MENREEIVIEVKGTETVKMTIFQEIIDLNSQMLMNIISIKV